MTQHSLVSIADVQSVAPDPTDLNYSIYQEKII